MAGDVFVLGAGFSKAVSPSMPVLAELSKEVNDSIGHAWENDWGDDLRKNVELLLTHLATRQPWKNDAAYHYDRGKFTEIRNVLVHRLRSAEKKAARDEGDPPRWATELVRSWHETRTTVLTFNYDTLVERIFRKSVKDSNGRWAHHTCLYPVPVTPAGSRYGAIIVPTDIETFGLLKLHGSVSWWYSGEDAPPSDVVYESAELGWGNEYTQMDRAKRAVLDKEPLVVPPMLQKSPFYENTLLRAQWQRAREALADADRVVCIGYSLPLTDLTSRLLISTSSSGLEVVLVDRNPSELLPHYRHVLSGFDVHADVEGEHAVADFTQLYI